MDRHHVWSKIDIPLKATGAYRNPYTEVEVWVDLEGPGFAKRIYGFWDGGIDFVVRVMATAPGTWRWRSGSTPADTGLAGKSGTFEAVPWSEAELAENPNRRGMVVATPDGRGLQYADGTPFFLLGDTWWSVPSFRFPLAETDAPKPLAKGATLNDYVHYRKKQGFNSVGIVAMHPAWANDGKPRSLQMEDGTWVRAAWGQPGTDSAKDMHNEGGRPFEFPGKVPGFEDVFPDMDRINPDYFKVLDRKIDYLNSLGFVPFIEASRRDTGQAWKKFYDWPVSYARYVQYLFARLQANIAILSPIHYDYFAQTITAREYNEACNLVVERWGKPPFGTLLSANPNPSTLVNFGGPDACKWLDLHQIGNVREHHTYWYLTEIHRSEPKKPALNGEPYYAGLHQLGTPYPLRVSPTATPIRLTSAPPSMAASCPAASPGSSMAAKASGRPTPKTVAPQDVGRVPVALRRSGAPSEDVRLRARHALPRAGAGCRTRRPQQDWRHRLLLRLVVLRPLARTRSVPHLFRARRRAQCDRPRCAAGGDLSAELVRSARRHLAGAGRTDHGSAELIAASARTAGRPRLGPDAGTGDVGLRRDSRLLEPPANFFAGQRALSSMARLILARRSLASTSLLIVSRNPPLTMGSTILGVINSLPSTMIARVLPTFSVENSLSFLAPAGVRLTSKPGCPST